MPYSRPPYSRPYINPYEHLLPGAHQMEPPSPLISWANPFPSRFINRTIFFCYALESHECACCLLSFLYFHWLFPLLAHETSSGNCSIYKSTRERVDSNGLYERWRLHLMGSCFYQMSLLVINCDQLSLPLLNYTCHRSTVSITDQ